MMASSRILDLSTWLKSTNTQMKFTSFCMMKSTQKIFFTITLLLTTQSALTQLSLSAPTWYNQIDT